jgi:fumarate hydratase class II
MGNFELNVMLPVDRPNLLESIRLLAAVSRVFADKCIHGIEADGAVLPVRRVVAAIATALNRSSATKPRRAS